MPTPTLAPALMRGTASTNLFVACTSQELRLQIDTVVRDIAPRWGERGNATIVLDSPLLGRAAAEAAFDEVDEKWHIDGIDLRIHHQQGERVRVILEPRRS